MIIKVTGDTHGDRDRMREYIEQHNKIPSFDVLLVCGDFGYLFKYNNKGERKFLDKIEEQANFELWFIDGNHENFDTIYNSPIEEWNGGKIHRIRKNIIHLMRGEVYTINNKNLFTFGGGYSIDKYDRLEYEERTMKKVWWEKELPTEKEIQNAYTNLEKVGWRIDYVFTHSAPNALLPAVKEFFISEIKEETDILTDTLEDIRRKLTFKHWCFGHYHGEKAINDQFTILHHTSKIIEI